MPRWIVTPVTRRTTNIKGHTATHARRATGQATGIPLPLITNSTRSIPYEDAISRQHACPVTRAISTKTRRRITVTPAIRKRTHIRDNSVDDANIAIPSGTGKSYSLSMIAIPRTDYRATIEGRNVRVVTTAPCSRTRRRPLAMHATKKTISTMPASGTHARSAIQSSNGNPCCLIMIATPPIPYSASIAR